jgi:hypothetical protein
MRVEIVRDELQEAVIHLEELVNELRAGKIDDRGEPTVSVQLAHVLDHVCRAWNCKDISPEQKSKLTQEEFNRLSNTVPNFLGERILGDFASA